MLPILQLVKDLLDSIASLIVANGDSVKEEDALMDAQEKIKAELDRRKFGV